MIMVGIKDSISIHCLCINCITGLFVEWADSQKSNSILWKFYSAFTSKMVSRLFKSLHMGQRYSCVSNIQTICFKIMEKPILSILYTTHTSKWITSQSLICCKIIWIQFLKYQKQIQIFRDKYYEYPIMPSLLPYTDQANELQKSIIQQVGVFGYIFTIQQTLGEGGFIEAPQYVIHIFW